MVRGHSTHRQAEVHGARTGIANRYEARPSAGRRQSARGIPHRALAVELLRENRIIASGIYAAGNQLLDTSNLPQGSYQIIIRIYDARGGMREERRLFTKQADIPVVGLDRFVLRAGTRIGDPYGGSLQPSRSLYLSAEWAHRVSEGFAFDAAAELIEGDLRAEWGAYVLSPVAVIRLAALTSASEIIGGAFQARSSGFSAVNFSLDVRHIEEAQFAYDLDGTRPALPGSPAPFLPLEASQEQITQIGGNLSYSTPEAQFYLSGGYMEFGRSEASYAIGPSVRWRLYEQGRFRLLFDGSASFTDQGEAAFAGLSLTWRGERTSSNLQIGQAISSPGANAAREGPFASFAHSLQIADFAGGATSLAGFAQVDPEQRLVGGSADYRNRSLGLTGEVIHSSHGEDKALQYTFAGRTRFFLGSGESGLSHEIQRESLAVVRVTGARQTDVFDIYLDQSKIGTLQGPSSLSFNLPAYRSYALRIRPISSGMISYDGRERQMTLFPGQVSRINFQVQPISPIFGQLFGDDQKPIAYARIEAGSYWGETDENGFFQVEAASGDLLQVTRADGRKMARHLPEFSADEETVRLGILTCCSDGDASRLAARASQ